MSILRRDFGVGHRHTGGGDFRLSRSSETARARCSTQIVSRGATEDLMANDRADDGLDGAADRLWDVQDVARYLKASRSWVYHRAEAGLLPCIRIGGLLRFDPIAIRASTVNAGRGQEGS